MSRESAPHGPSSQLWCSWECRALCCGITNQPILHPSCNAPNRFCSARLTAISDTLLRRNTNATGEVDGREGAAGGSDEAAGSSSAAASEEHAEEQPKEQQADGQPHTEEQPKPTKEPLP